MQVESRQSRVTVNQLPDGSKILVDQEKETVFALNATAGAAWDACEAPASVAEVAEKMERSLDAKVSEELAAATIAALEDKQLVTTSGAAVQASRRRFISQVGMAAIPLVAALTLTEQRAHADCARSADQRDREHDHDRDDHHHHREGWPRPL